MPCYDARDHMTKDAFDEYERLYDAERRLNKATRLLCAVLKWIDLKGFVPRKGSELQLWDEEHKLVDKVDLGL